MVAVLGGRKGRGRAFGGYGGAKGLGYLLGPVGGGLVVAAGGYRLLFAILAALAAAVGIAAAVLVPNAAPAPRQRSTLVQLARRIWRPEFLQPVLVLAAGTAALSAGVGFLPVVAAQDGLGPAATGALVSLLAATSALLQPWAGRRLDRGKIDAAKGGSLALVPIALGFLVAAMGGPVAALAVAAVLIGAGVGWSTPLGFAGLAASAPEGRMGETMGAGEVGREAGDAGGPLIVGAFGGLGITAGLVALATAIWAAAATSRQLTRQRSVAIQGPHDPPP
jgi:MFS family permease